MNGFGRIQNTVTFARGGPISLTVIPPLNAYPSIDPRSLGNALQMQMFQQGIVHFGAGQPIYTRHASGGCVPVCAAEITPAGVVLWTYLMHGHGGNPPVNVAAIAGNPAHVYVCLMVYSGASSFGYAVNSQDYYFNALDPGNAIPNANTLLIYGNHTDLAITRRAMIAVDIS